MEGARPLRVVLHPGETLFIPAGWWHTTETFEESVTVGGNFVDRSNWSEFQLLFDARNPPHSRRQGAVRRLAGIFAPRYLRGTEDLRTMGQSLRAKRLR